MAKKLKYIPAKQFIAAVLKHDTASGAARALGISRQAVSRRVAAYRKKGVRGLPEYKLSDIDVEWVQEQVDRHTGGK